MPYKIKKQGEKFLVVKKSDGKVIGTFDSREKALAQLKAIYANEGLNNLKINFVPESLKIIEAGQDPEGAKWLKIGGTALVEGISRNANIYTFENLKENDGKGFKWLVGHPDEPEEHIVGLGSLSLREGGLQHEGKIRNTAKHPDVVEAVVDKFLGPSIHASCKKVIKTQEGYKMEGLSIDGIGLVAFQGVEKASIDYAITESVDKRLNELMESLEEEEDENKNNDEGETMSEEEKPVQEPPKPEPQENKEMKLVLEELKKATERIAQLEKSVEEKKKSESAAIVEEKPKENQLFEEKNGDISFSERAYADFNKAIRERVR